MLKSGQPILGKGAAKLLLSEDEDVGEQQSLVVASRLRARRRQTAGGEHLSEHAVGDHLPVDEDAVAIEDDELRSERHGLADDSGGHVTRRRPRVKLARPCRFGGIPAETLQPLLGATDESHL
jgi:hypothetical protein